MPATFPELIRSFIDRRNLSVEQLATLANLSRKSVLQKLGVQMPFPIFDQNIFRTGYVFMRLWLSRLFPYLL